MMNEYINGRIDGWKGERRNGRMNPVSHPIMLRTEEWTDEWMDGMERRTDEWTDGIDV